MKKKYKVTIEGREHEVEIDVDPKELGLMTKDEIAQQFVPKDTFEPELDRRVKALTKDHVKLDDVKTNAELKQRVLDMLGVQVTSDGKAKITTDQLAALQETWRNTELKPVVESEKKAAARAAKLLDRILFADLVAAAAEANVHAHLRRPVSEGGVPPIVSMLAPGFGFSEEHESHFLRKGDGFEFSMDPKTTGKPYKTPREFVLEWAARPENKAFVDAAKPGAPSLGNPGGGSGGGVVKLDVTDGKPLTLQQYQEARKAAGDGGRVVVQDGAAAPVS